MFDSFNRRINYLRVSVTDRCNLRCRYCMPTEGVKKLEHDRILSYEQILAIVEIGVKMGIEKVRLTGGEPLVRKGIVSLVERLRKISGLKELALTTNGILLERFAVELKAAGLDRLNISLDTLRPERYADITRGGKIEEVFSGIRAAIAAGFNNTKINMVLIEGFNLDEVFLMERFCRENGLIMQRICHYQLHDRRQENKYQSERPLPCAACNRLRLTAEGYLKPCLFTDFEVKVDFKDIASSILKTLKMKPFAGSSCSQRYNYQIGG